MQLPRIMISFSRRDEDTTSPAAAPSVAPTPAAQLMPELGSITHAAAIHAVLAEGTLRAEDLVAARLHVASIRRAWDDFHTALDQERVLLQMSRHVELVEQLAALEQRQPGISRQFLPMPPSASVTEVDA
jgi:hypothetical protein